MMKYSTDSKPKKAAADLRREMCSQDAAIAKINEALAATIPSNRAVRL